MQIKRKPDWLKVKLPNTSEFKQVKGTLTRYQLHSVCQEAMCPNITECFHSGTATFLILGDACTRHCLYCNVQHRRPVSLDIEEPARLAAAVKELGLKYIVITSVTRDDLPDGGASIFAECIERLHAEVPKCKVEVLIPDFLGNKASLNLVIAAKPDVLNHNIEVVRRMFPSLRPQGDYQRSLELIRRAAASDTISKSGFMVGVGETIDEVHELLEDLKATGCERVTIGQYLQPSREHWTVDRYYTPEEFENLKHYALSLGFTHVESGPLVRSSYHAAQALNEELV
ncbi:lipoyl synthase [Candidatus Wirthbacteria bacterium CG2_30_54_11]|uniref:Lipoyl synthase n=1 Tax=Candidatus Wirthbacteria bacterium CG2_30_54_11 TaxID=1817892 RepID=A0A1J5J2J3_9BACT|nr:MAG: lipoyl synthase [Candidatus Wirthbacteria bacterium CG2_30_54_11]